MVLVSTTSRAPTPASSWVVICALKPRSTRTSVVQRCVLRGRRALSNRLSNYYTARSRQDLTVDTRTATEYGVVRTFFDATFSWTSGHYAGTRRWWLPSTRVRQAGGNGGVGNPSDGGIAGGSVGVYHAFIQFAGFTMGKTISPFDAPWVNYPGNNFDGLVGGSGDVTARQPADLHRSVRQRRVGHRRRSWIRPPTIRAT